MKNTFFFKKFSIGENIFLFVYMSERKSNVAQISKGHSKCHTGKKKSEIIIRRENCPF